MPFCWETLATARPPSPDDQALAAALLAEYQRLGHLPRTCRAMLELPDAVIIAFYARRQQVEPKLCGQAYLPLVRTMR